MNDTEQLENIGFEELLERLEESVDMLESGDLPIEGALQIFEDGIKLSKELAKRLAAAEKKIAKLTTDASGEPIVEDFEEE